MAYKDMNKFRETKRRATAKWRELNPEKAREINRKAAAKWRASNPERATREAMERREKEKREHPERVLARGRKGSSAYVRRNPVKCRERYLDWRARNPEKAAALDARGYHQKCIRRADLRLKRFNESLSKLEASCKS